MGTHFYEWNAGRRYNQDLNSLLIFAVAGRLVFVLLPGAENKFGEGNKRATLQSDVTLPISRVSGAMQLAKDSANFVS